MYEELYAPIPDVNAYLERIGLTRDEVDLSAATLDRLIVETNYQIPFENIDVWDKGACPDLGIEALFDKIVTRRRGGYCFEINGLFAAVLRGLGFEAYDIAVRIMRGREYKPPYAHRATVAVVNGEKYFCDVGFGVMSMGGAVHINGETNPKGLSAKLENGVCTVYDNGQVLMVFNDEYCEAVDFLPLNFYVSQSQGHSFRANLSVSIATERGRKQLVNYRLKDRAGDEVISEIEVSNKTELSALLLEHFGIAYTFEES